MQAILVLVSWMNSSLSGWFSKFTIHTAVSLKSQRRFTSSVVWKQQKTVVYHLPV